MLALVLLSAEALPRPQFSQWLNGNNFQLYRRLAVSINQKKTLQKPFVQGLAHGTHAECNSFHYYPFRFSHTLGILYSSKEVKPPLILRAGQSIGS